MNRTNIEWVKNPDGTQGYTWNPITGCLNHDNGLCKGGGFTCYAYKLAHGRLRERYLANKNIAPIGTMIVGAAMVEKALKDPFYPRFWQNRIDAALGYMPKALYKGGWIHQGKGIFVCDMGELFGDWIPREWQEQIFEVINWYKGNRFYLLTKQPQNLPKWSPFPDNCWVLATATNFETMDNALTFLPFPEVKAKVKGLSIEPFLEEIPVPSYGFEVNWIIMGACTGSRPDMEALIKRYPDLTLMPYGKIWTAQPQIEWVQDIVEEADRAGIAVFLKDNLKPLFAELTLMEGIKANIFDSFQINTEHPERNIIKLRQEFPKGEEVKE